MVSIVSLWLPILLSAVFVFIISTIIHMFLPYHRSDLSGLKDEEKVMDALRDFNIPPGDYCMPHAGDPETMKSKEFQDRVKKGPVAIFTFYRPEDFLNMIPSMVMWFFYIVLVSLLSSYIATRVLEPGAYYLSVSRFVGATAFMCYSIALLQNSIWFKRKWSTTFKSMFDGLIYALFTAGTFGWLWPAA